MPSTRATRPSTAIVKHFSLMTSVGSNSSATGANAVALGGGAVANGSGSLALGGAAAVTGTNNTVVGAQANANGTGLVAIGQGATANTSGSVAIGQTSSANGQNGVAVGWSASAGGSNSVAIGQSASATRAGDVAIGVGSVDAAPNPTANATIGTTTFSSFAGSAPTSVFSIGSIGNERQLTNVAAGRITANSTDAVNGSELFAVASQVATLSTSFTSLTQQLAASAATTQLLGGTATGANSTAVGSSSTATAANSTAVGQAAQAVGVNSTAIGTNTSATGTNTLANGNGAVASGDNSTALGANAHASAANSVALGAGSVADQANTVSVGSPGNERRVTNVAAGINPTDAVNMSQLQGVQASVNSVARRAYSGVAGAVALSMIPDVDAGKTIAVGVGTGGFQGYGAVALGFTARINGNIKIRAGASTSSAGSTYGGGVSYQW